MAVATGVVYAIGCAESSLVKIGHSAQGADARRASFQTHSPVLLTVLWSQPGNHITEGFLHRKFAERRRHGEWFDFGDDDPVVTIHTVYFKGMEKDGFPLGRVRPTPDFIFKELSVVLTGREAAS